MNTRAISTSVAVSACDVCGRTLLRGERAETYVNGGERHTVCELCTSRALHGGWLREGELPDYGDTSARIDRRRSLLSRLRPRREAPTREPEAELSYAYEEPESPLPPAPPAARPAPAPRAPAPVRADPAPSQREPRHVRAVPTSSEHRVLTAMELFNASEHPRTVAGISRSLGLPEVAVLPSGAPSALVNVVVAWELCWYRYELDLSDEVPTVRVATQGYELDELPAEERRPNAQADEHGRLSLLR
ncbi:MAG: hypothetical protein ABI323_12745 [Solirubrobacteraceae bacterium]